MVSAAKAAKRQKAIDRANAIMKGVEAQLTQENYGSDLLRALNYYNANHDDKEKKKWLISHIAKTDKKFASELLRLDEYHFRYAGILARLMDGGSELREKEATYFSERINVLKGLLEQLVPVAAVKKTTAAAPVLSIQDRIDEAARKHGAEIDGAIDDFITKKNADFSAKNYLAANNVSAPIAKRIGDFYVRTYNELADAINGEDEQLVEGYSNFTARQLKSFHKFVGQIIDDCQQMVQTAKASRAPRKRKPVSPAKLAAKVKFLKEFAELNLKSVRPENIVGASELWVYNTKYRKLQVYKAESELSVKGTSVIGFDVKQSTSVTLRKPEEFFKGLTLGKRPLNAAIKNVKTKPATPNGRLNEDCILLGAF